MLPKFRGAEPLFWQMKYASEMGVSWHYVNSEFDAGDIVAQKSTVLYDGESYAEISHRLATKGADLLLDVLLQIDDGNLVATTQPSSAASSQSYPRPEDFIVNPTWSAQHAYNFMCATHAFGIAYQCQLGADVYLLKQAVDYDNNDSLADVEVQGDKLYIPCAEGVLIATYTGRL